MLEKTCPIGLAAKAGSTWLQIIGGGDHSGAIDARGLLYLWGRGLMCNEEDSFQPQQLGSGGADRGRSAAWQQV